MDTVKHDWRVSWRSVWGKVRAGNELGDGAHSCSRPFFGLWLNHANILGNLFRRDSGKGTKPSGKLPANPERRTNWGSPLTTVSDGRICRSFSLRQRLRPIDAFYDAARTHRYTNI